MSTNETVNETEGTEEDLVTDFNLEEDFRPEPLVPNGTYSANVIDLQYKKDKACFAWKVCLDGNGGFMSDGETNIDGVQLFFNNWLPKKGDDSTPTPSGRTTKFQSKVNMLKQFADGMKINMNTIAAVEEAIANGDYIGMPVKVKVATKEYPEGSGKFSNEIQSMVAA